MKSIKRLGNSRLLVNYNKNLRKKFILLIIPLIILIVSISIYVTAQRGPSELPMANVNLRVSEVNETKINRYADVEDEDIRIAISGLEYEKLKILCRMASERNMQDERKSLSNKIKISEFDLEKTIVKYGIRYLEIPDRERQPDIKNAIEMVMENQVDFVGGDRGSKEIRSVIFEIKTKLWNSENELIRIKSK